MYRGTAHERGYDAKWQRRRRVWLLNHPLCRYCHEADRVEPATVVDHIIPHRGDKTLFWDETNWQSLCKSCHDAAKQAEEKKGYAIAVGVDGWPLDPLHPSNVQITPEHGKNISKSIGKLRKTQGGEGKK